MRECRKNGSHKNVELTYKGKRLFLSYYTQGRGDPPIVILPGLGGSHLEWERLVLPYLNIKRRVIVIDWPSHGYSSVVEDPVFEDLIAVLKLFFDRLRIKRVILVGHSMGAAAALAIAVTYPEMVQGVLAQGAPYLIRDQLGFTRGFAEYLRATNRMYPDLAHFRKGVLLFLRVPQIMAWIFETSDMLAMSPEFSHTILGHNFRHLAPGVYADVLRNMSDFDLRDTLSELSEDIPVLLTDGDRIKIPFLDTLAGLSRLIPHAKTRVIKNAGHLASLSHPEEFCRILESFIDEIGRYQVKAAA